MIRIWRNRGPAEKAVILAACLAVLAGLLVFVPRLFPEKCGSGLEETGPDGECIGVTAEGFVFEEDLEELLEDVGEENARVRKAWEDPEDGKARIPYVRIALMMPLTRDATSAMTIDLIKHGLAGAHLGQLRANQGSGLHYQLLLANDGKDLDLWKPVVEQLAGMTDDESPLVAVMGYPNSNPETQKAADALSRKRIPSIGPVLTSPDMSSEYLFKTSASNEHVATALAGYLEEHPGSGAGFLVWDAREKDNYAVNLREVFEDRFGAEYGLRKRNASYLGTIGPDTGIPKRFGSIAQKICLTEADTVFYAGRDRDLPALVSQLAGQPNCDHEKPVRIMKLGIGRDPVFTTPETTEQMRKARITTVAGASVAPRWWEQGEGRPPGFADFHKVFQEHVDAWNLGKKPLDDGYTIMYHDAFRVASLASEEAYNALSNRTPKNEPVPLPTKDDVYSTISNMSVLGTEEGSSCVNCVVGASGTFGFDADPSTDQWPVCKPVPVVVYPKDNGTGTKRGEPYRTHQDIFGGKCLDKP